MLRRLLSILALALGVAVLVARIQKINELPRVELAPRTMHLLYLDSLRTELLSFAEQYGRPIFYTDTTPLVNGSGRIQVARLRQALFDSRIQYSYGDKGFNLDWATDPKPRIPKRYASFNDFYRALEVAGHRPVASAWPETAAEYARLRRDFITPRWPEMPQRRVNRPRSSPVPPHGDASITD